jgi:hypothetical protein
MIHVQTAVRAWVQPQKKKRKGNKANRGYRKAKFDERVLVFDTETTTDFTQRLLFGVFQLYQHGALILEGLILGDSLKSHEIETIRQYGAQNDIQVHSRADFVHKIFFRHVYGLGALCVGFNLPFDLSRIASWAGRGRGKNIRKFRLTLSRLKSYSAIRVEAISGKAAFIEFALKKELQDWESPFFKGRFLDLSTLANALTGTRFSLRRAAIAFKTTHKKTSVDLGAVTREALEYCRNDVTVTWELFEKLRDEYLKYPFSTMENEREQPDNTVPITRIYSTASVAKGTLRFMGFSGAVLGTSGE